MKRKDQLEEQASEVASELSVWRSFTEHAGWQRLLKVIEGQILTRESVLSQPLHSMDAVLEQEFVKGERSFGQLLMKLPEIELERLQAEAERLDKDIEYATDAETTAGSGSDVGRTAGGDLRLDERTNAFGDDAG